MLNAEMPEDKLQLMVKNDHLSLQLQLTLYDMIYRATDTFDYFLYLTMEAHLILNSKVHLPAFSEISTTSQMHDPLAEEDHEMRLKTTKKKPVNGALS